MTRILITEEYGYRHYNIEVGQSLDELVEEFKNIPLWEIHEKYIVPAEDVYLGDMEVEEFVDYLKTFDAEIHFHEEDDTYLRIRNHGRDIVVYPGGENEKV